MNITKVQENIRFLGVETVRIDNTEKRGAVRKLLNGLGFSTADYIELTMPQLQSVYADLLTGYADSTDSLNALYLIKNCRFESRKKAIEDFQSTVKITGQLPVMPIIEVKQEEITVSQIAQPEKKKAMPTITPEAAMQVLMTALSGNKTPIDKNEVIAIVKEEMKTFQKPLPTEIKIISGDKVSVVMTGVHHYKLPDLIKAAKSEGKNGNRLNIMLVGAAGSGKTTLIHQVAEALELPFYFNGAIDSEYKLTGFIDAQGRIVSTAFRKAYENGGVYLFDEMDSSMASALLAFNAALANGHMDFPDGNVKRHKDFYCFAATNTFGKGADRVYVGRNQLDAASLDRFVMFVIDYDESLERELAGNDNWVRKVQQIRKNVETHKLRHVVSPRASINGAQLLAAGFSENDVLEMTIYKGLDRDSKLKIAC